MKVVLDTNVFVSGVFFGGLPGQILAGWRDGKLEVVISPEIVEEYVRVGERLSARFPGVDLEPSLELLAASATLARPAPLEERVCRDPDDDKFLACAVHASAAYVVSGDRALLDASPYRGVRVKSPRAFVETVLR